MADFELKFEWEESPGVREQALATTWARLEIWIGQECVTRVREKNSGNIRNGVYGSLLPLVEWAIENWWFLTAEPQRLDTLAPARILGKVPTWRHWIHRHNLLAARSGGALPDLFFARSDEYISMTWYSDPLLGDEQRVQFLSQCSQAQFIPSAEVIEKLAILVTAVLDRLKEQGCAYRPELYENWDAIRKADADAIRLCQRAARLGIDAYDFHEISEELERTLQESFGDWPDGVIDEFLDCAFPDKIEESIREVGSALRALGSARGRTVAPTSFAPPADTGFPPYELGYEIARRVRREVFGIDLAEPFVEFRRQIAERFSWPSEQQCEKFELPADQINGLLGHSADGSLHLLTSLTSFPAQNFAIARGLFHLLMHHANGTPLLLTTAHAYKQQAGRAFAAELLAPAEALNRRIRPVVSGEAIGKLADQFSVSPRVIVHQIENHKLADVEPT